MTMKWVLDPNYPDKLWDQSSLEFQFSYSRLGEEVIVNFTVRFIDPCANSDFEYYLLSSEEVSFVLESVTQNTTLQFSDKYSDFFGEPNLCGDPILVGYEEFDSKGAKHSDILVDVFDVGVDEFKIVFPPLNYTFDSPYNSIYRHIPQFTLTLSYTRANYPGVKSISKEVMFENTCLTVMPYFSFDSIANYTQGQARTSFTLNVRDDVSDRIGKPGICGSYSFLRHNLSDFLTVTAIDITTFTVTIGDPSLEFDDIADRLIPFRIEFQLIGVSIDYSNLELIFEGGFWLTMEYCLKLSVSSLNYYSLKDPTTTVSIPVTFALEGDCAPVETCGELVKEVYSDLDGSWIQELNGNTFEISASTATEPWLNAGSYDVIIYYYYPSCPDIFDIVSFDLEIVCDTEN